MIVSADVDAHFDNHNDQLEGRQLVSGSRCAVVITARYDFIRPYDPYVRATRPMVVIDISPTHGVDNLLCLPIYPKVPVVLISLVVFALVVVCFR